MPRFISDKPAEALMFRCGLALYLAVILIGSIPGARAEVGEVASGLVLHFVTYACIAYLLACGAAGSLTARAIKAFCIVVVMGALDEGIQSFLPYRNGALADWMVDMSAALFVTLTWRIRGNGKTETV
ncbi:VanZ family protein [Noviherbaspirillum sp. ST9]|uniref:VanZ family protein n=1 Tax=Noviherbaspirillum sp. ST9 TaxID=3401606 RepID=UPI003B5893EF